MTLFLDKSSSCSVVLWAKAWARVHVPSWPNPLKLTFNVFRPTFSYKKKNKKNNKKINMEKANVKLCFG